MNDEELAWTDPELRHALEQYKVDLIVAKLAAPKLQAYEYRAARFLD